MTAFTPAFSKKNAFSKIQRGTVKLIRGAPILPPGVPPHSSTQRDICLMTWDKFFKHHKPQRNGTINVRIRRDGDTCLDVMWYLFFLQEQEHQSSPVGEICAICEMSYSSCIKSFVTLPWKLLAASFCSLPLASQASCVYKLNSNYTTGWQRTEFMHLCEAWRFGMAVNT